MEAGGGSRVSGRDEAREDSRRAGGRRVGDARRPEGRVHRLQSRRDELVARLRTFRRHGIHVLGSFIFGLRSDTPATFDATVALAEQADLTFAQFVLLTPFPGTVDFDKWATEEHPRGTAVDGILITQHWLIPEERRPRLYAAHPTMSLEEIRVGTQGAWNRF
jgi:hypothetical protein